MSGLLLLARSRLARRLALTAVAATVLGAVVLAVVVTGFVSGAQGTATALDVRSCGAALKADQAANAQTIVQVGQRANVPEQGIVIAVATALQESGLHNLRYGDRDSLGLFQQRPSQGWGAPAQVLTPSYAAAQFYRHLADVPDWQAMTLTDAAQAVQASAFPDAYAKWEPEAVQIVNQLVAGSLPSGCGGDGAATSEGPATVPAGYTIPASATPREAAAIQFALAQLGKPYSWGATGPAAYDCSGLVQAAWAAGGVGISRTTSTQVHDGSAVPDAAELRPGDLVFIAGADGTLAHPGHVGLYIGDGYVVQAPHTGDVVRVTPLRSWADEIADIRHIA